MKLGDVVKYRNAVDQGDEVCRFVVTELRGERVLLTEFAVTHDMAIKPTYVVDQTNLVLA